MIKRTLGRTGIPVTALGMGCYQFTQEFGVKPETADAILDYAMDHGITFYDTAHVYGFGESEELVGRALRRHADRELHVSTKVGYIERIVSWVWGKCTKETDWAAHLNPTEIRRLIKHSMWLLQLDCLEILSIHEFDWPMWQIDYENGTAVVISVLEELKKEGLIRNIGLGGWGLHQAAMLMKTGKFDVVLPAGGLTLLERPIYKELLPVCQEQNAGVLLGGGFGSGTPFLLDPEPCWLEVLKREDSEEMEILVQKLSRIYKLAEETGMSLPEITLRYILAQEEIHCHVAGAREVAHVEANIAAIEKGPLEQDYLSEIDAVQKMGQCPDTAALRDLAKKLMPDFLALHKK